MSLRGRQAGLRARRRNNAGSLIDLTPLIDVVFQLLIFFVLTSTFQNNPAFNVQLPKAQNREVVQEPKAIVVTLSASGDFEVDGEVVDERELELRLCAAAQDAETTGVNIKADQATQHQYVVTVMDIAKTCGLQKLGILHGT